MTQNYKAVVVGVSAGGLEALCNLIPSLPEGFPVPVVVVQHRRANTDDFLSAHLHEQSQLRVKEADDKELVRPGTVYLAPGGYHLLMERDGTFALSLDERVNHSRPSVDVLFDSAADAYRDKLIGVVLTGSNSDGSRGLKHIKQCGGLAVVQDPARAEADCMPREAIKATPVDRILALEDIAPFLVQCCPVDETLNNYALATDG
ncbi:MAG: chemotaxis protein CheB [Candidatus Nealsonbacteria bacterium]|nr:chemotaxis protein CheB [Candidatus Nealsonbacteria bacterium]